jgi:hypothetical protein
MANTIRLKKRASGGASGAPSSLAPSEPAYSEVDNILYYGFGDAGGGAASSVISIAGSGAFTTLTTNQTISGNKTFTGTVDLSGATLSGNTTFSNNLTVSGDLTVSGTTTTVNSTQVDVADKNITLGNVSTPTDSTADGGGISLKGATDKLFRWLNATDSWTSSEHIDLASGKEFKINGTSVLSGSTLGSGVTGSSLTSVGTIATGVWNGTDIGVAHGGTGASTASAARTNLGVAIGSDVQAYDADLDNLSGCQSGASAALAALTSTEVQILDGATVTTAELNILDGVTSTAAELNILDGVTSTTAELNILDGVTATTSELNILDGVTSTASELNILDGATVTTTELNILDGNTSATSTTLAAADRMVMNDAGTMKQVALSDLVTFLEDGATSGFDIDGGTF